MEASKYVAVVTHSDDFGPPSVSRVHGPFNTKDDAEAYAQMQSRMIWE